MKPGATAFTRMRGASARASATVRLLSAAFDAQYGIELPVAIKPATLETFTMMPPPRAFERRPRGASALERAHQVHRQDRSQSSIADGLEVGVRDEARRAGVVDEHVEASELAGRVASARQAPSSATSARNATAVTPAAAASAASSAASCERL